LTLRDWLAVSPLMLLASVAAEITKALQRRRTYSQSPATGD
jgi:hypothetical protein